MTDLRTAAKQALASLEEWADAYPHRADDDDLEVISALRYALQPCNWWEEDGAWTTGCARRFVLEAGTPSDNSMSYCCYCGSVIKEVEA